LSEQDSVLEGLSGLPHRHQPKFLTGFEQGRLEIETQECRFFAKGNGNGRFRRRFNLPL
jgi:hypothetical protein